MPFGIPPELAFSFAGIPRSQSMYHNVLYETYSRAIRRSIGFQLSGRERFNYAAIRDDPVTFATGTQSPQFIRESGEVSDLMFNFCKVLRCDAVYFAAVLILFR